jgi:hypothetical protein
LGSLQFLQSVRWQGKIPQELELLALRPALLLGFQVLPIQLALESISLNYFYDDRKTHLSWVSAAFLGAGASTLNMSAQLFFTPAGMTLEAALATAATGLGTDEPQDASSVVFAVVSVGFEVSSVVVSVVSHALESVVAGVGSIFSLRDPFVCATEAPRAFPPLPRSVPRPRPPLPLSKPPRPPRDGRDVLVESANAGAELSLAFDLDRSFLPFETSPHCAIVPT